MPGENSEFQRGERRVPTATHRSTLTPVNVLLLAPFCVGFALAALAPLCVVTALSPSKHEEVQQRISFSRLL